MAFSHGKKSVFKIRDSSCTVVNLSQFLTNVSLPRDADTAETTTFTSTDKSYIPGARGGTGRVEGIWSTTAVTTLHGILGKTKHFWWWPSTAALIFKGDLILNSFEATAPVAGAVTFTAGGQLTGYVPLSATSS